MTGSDFRILRNAVRSGEEKYVENRVTRTTGRVIFCGGDRLEVAVGERRESWPMGVCEETMGSRFGHRERTLDKPPWDTDRLNPYH